MRQRAEELDRLVESHRRERVVVCGMGGSSLAPLVIGRLAGAPLDVLDTTHPAALRRLELDGALFVISSKSGTTVETRCQFDHLWERTRKRAESFLVITDPGSVLETLARERGVTAVAGEPTIGGRYSALSVFGLVPAALAGVDVGRLLARAEEMHDACRVADGNPALELGLSLGAGWEEGRDKVVFEQSRAASGSGSSSSSPSRPARRARASCRRPASPRTAGTGRAWRSTSRARTTSGRSSFASSWPRRSPARSSASTPSTSRTSKRRRRRRSPSSIPDMSRCQALGQAPKRRWRRCSTAFGRATTSRFRRSSIRNASASSSLSSSRRARPAASSRWASARATSTRPGQLHKGGPPTGHFIQVVDDAGPDVAIPKRKFGFRRLIEAQAAGDYEALRARGRPVVRVKLEDL